MVVGRLTGRPVFRSGARQLALGGLAIAVTSGVGHLIGGHGAWRSARCVLGRGLIRQPAG
jgi:hypothetical protein